jgi:hypothetical protein
MIRPEEDRGMNMDINLNSGNEFQYDLINA